jgi:large subunit ribosomal protein L1
MSGKASKRYTESLAKVPEGAVSVLEAATVLKGLGAPKFDPTIELVMHLGIDPKQSDQALRGSLSLPHGIGSTRSVIAFCDESEIEAAMAAGATEAGCEDLVKKVQGGWMDFDVAVATPKVMRDVSKLGRVLGPQGKMPSPKAGTVGPNLAEMIAEFAAGKVEFRNDDGGNLHVPVGKLSFDADKIADNANAFIDFVRKNKPATSKGTFFKRVCLSATMMPSVQLEV